MGAIRMLPRFVALVILVCAPASYSAGPLRVLESNPRYLTDGSGKAVYLAGSHTWYNLQDNGLMLTESQDPPRVFDYSGFLDFLAEHNHNFFRLWRWEVPKWTDSFSKLVHYCQPHPWPRSGPDTARDGKPKFDIAAFDQAYFDRLRARVVQARDRGMYVSVMLFEGWAPQFTDAWTYHPFQAENNVNGIDGDAMGYFTVQRTAMGRRILELQEAYVRKVIDTVNNLDNVLYEVCNEAGPYSTEWQYHIIRYVKEYEASKPKRHLVGMTFQYRGGSNATLFNSPADWISPNPGDGNEYRENPPADNKGKVVVNDTDHLWGHTGGDAVWVWKSFCRGLNVLFMEEPMPSPTWQDSARQGMKQTRQYAEKINLAAMTPQNQLASTGYCLADKGREYLAFQPGSQGQFSVDLRDARGSCAVEWMNVSTGAIVAGKRVEGGARRTFPAPFGGPAAVYIKCSGAAGSP